MLLYIHNFQLHLDSSDGESSFQCPRSDWNSSSWSPSSPHASRNLSESIRFRIVVIYKWLICIRKLTSETNKPYYSRKRS